MNSWKEKFYELFMPHDTYEKGNLEKAFELKYSNFPKSLFKYYSVSDYSINNLNKNVIWLSYPSSFNDPYDSSLIIDNMKLVLSAYSDKKMITEFLIKHFSDKQIPEYEINGTLFEVVRKITKDAQKQKEIDIVEKVIKEYIETNVDKDTEMFWKKLGKSLSVCCFSETNKSVIMWSHYANNHQGFCLEYDFLELPYSDIRNRMLFPVFYSEQRYDMTQLFLNKKNDPSIALKASLHKSLDWAYEKEWRMVISGGVLNECEYHVPKPNAVYLGSRLLEEKAETIKQIAKEKNIKIYEMALSKFNYEMETREVIY